jgi:zinc protease
MFSADAFEPAGSFGVASIYAPQNRERVERVIREEIERALAQGFSDAEVEAGKRGLLQARRVARGQDAALAGRLSNYLYWNRTFAWDVELEKRIAALTPAEIRDALRRYIDPKKLSVLKAGDFK